MANYAKKIRTDKGDLQIDYNALANLPKSDTALKEEGGFADAKVVGDKLLQLTQRNLEQDTQILEINTRFAISNFVTAKQLENKGYITADSAVINNIQTELANVTPDKIGAAKNDLSNVSDEVIRDVVINSGIGGIPVVAAKSADGITYTATVPGVTELTNGMLLTIIPDVVSASTIITLNVNGLGAKEVRIPLSYNNASLASPQLETYFSVGRPLTLQYDAAYKSNKGAWKTLGKQRTSADDLSGILPIERGGTGATDAAAARTNLGIALANLGDVIITDTTPTTVTNGKWYLVKAEV